MTNPFSFHGRLGQFTYALWAIPIFFSQHLLVWLIARAYKIALPLELSFGIYPWRSIVADAARIELYVNRPMQVPLTVLVIGFAFSLLVGWALVALSYRRVIDANADAILSAAALAPLVQIPVILLLCILSTDEAKDETPIAAADRQRELSGWGGGLKGMLAGMALTLAAVAISALGFGTYGYGIFLLSPFWIGAVTGFFANFNRDITGGETCRLVAATSFMGGLALVAAALEGIVCIIMAAPLGIGVAIVGGLLGRELARSGRTSGGRMASSVAILPIVFAIEAAFPPLARFDTMQTIEVRASTDRVWKAIVQMETIEEPISLAHRLGLAYPLRGRVFGAGVGALRYGDFSTGTAIERVTEWQEKRKLAFVVLKDIPGLRELSPYRHVHAPHVHGYFTTRETSFELIEKPGGITEIVERTSHELKLDPALYWLPFARYMVDQNNARVLRHIKQQAENSTLALRQ